MSPAESGLENGTSILFYCHRKRLKFRVLLMSQKEQKSKPRMKTYQKGIK